MWLVFHRVDAGASSFVSTGIHYQDTTRAIKKALSFDKVFVKVGKSLPLIVKRVLSLEQKASRQRHSPSKDSLLQSYDMSFVTFAPLSFLRRC